MFHNQTRVVMLLTVEPIVSDIPSNVCRLADQPHHTHRHRSYPETCYECC